MVKKIILCVIAFAVVLALIFGVITIVRRNNQQEQEECPDTVVYQTEPSMGEDGILRAGQIYLEPEVPPTEDIIRQGPKGAIPATEEDIAKAGAQAKANNEK